MFSSVDTFCFISNRKKNLELELKNIIKMKITLLGEFEDELNGKIMTKFVRLRSKLYS